MQTLTNGAKILELSDKATLEALVDAVGLARLTAELVEICHDKADHLRSNWNDRPAAARWVRNAAKLAKASNQLEMEW